MGIMRLNGENVGLVKVLITCSVPAPLAAVRLVENEDMTRGIEIARITNLD